eukprot:307177-Ditylum_brightwellii.AAC.1
MPQQDTIDALANLASATADNRNSVANLTNSNTTLASQIKTLTQHTTQQKEEMNNMKANIADIISLLQDSNLHSNNNNCNCGGRGNHDGRPTNWHQSRQRNNNARKYITVGLMASLEASTIQAKTVKTGIQVIRRMLHPSTAWE